MTPQELKNSILQLAIQGKLVEQREDEGTAEELYKQIQAEKQALIKVGKIKKEKPLPEIAEDEIPFEIPESWKWVRLNNVLKSILVPQRDKPQVFGGNIPWCRIEDIDGKYLNGTKSGHYVSTETVRSMNLKVNPIGTVISANSASVGAAAITTVECVTNQTFVGLVCMNGLFNEYLYYYLIANKTNLRKMGSGTTIMYVSQDKYKKMLFPLPPMAEQMRIVAKIEELLPFIDGYEKAWSRLEALSKRFPGDMQKSILQMAIQGKLVVQRPEEGTGEELYRQIQTEKQALIKAGKIKKEKPLLEITEDEIPFEIPESWKWVRFSDIATFENGDRSSKYPVESDYVEYGVPFFGAKDMGKKYMSFNEVRYISMEKYNELGNGKLKDKDFICLLRGSVGKCAIFSADDKHPTGFICAQMIIIRCFNTSLCDYVFTFLSSHYYAKSIESKVTGTAVRQLPGKELGRLLIPLPPLAEQKRIVARLEELLPLCERLK